MQTPCREISSCHLCDLNISSKIGKRNGKACPIWISEQFREFAMSKKKCIAQNYDSEFFEKMLGSKTSSNRAFRESKRGPAEPQNELEQSFPGITAELAKRPRRAPKRARAELSGNPRGARRAAPQSPGGSSSRAFRESLASSPGGPAEPKQSLNPLSGNRVGPPRGPQNQR